MLRCSGLFYACKNGAEARRFNPAKRPHFGRGRATCSAYDLKFSAAQGLTAGADFF
jgi:hypothetical protein